MLKLLALPLVFALSTTAPVHADCVSDAKNVCVPRTTVDKLNEITRDRQCLDSTKPDASADTLQVVVDKDGRVFSDGNLNVNVKWCQYELKLSSKLNVVAAQKENPTWGFDFKLKLAGSTQPTEMFRTGNNFADGMDLGLAVEPVFYRDFNLNALVGIHTTGLAVGYNLTNTATVFLGVVTPWSGFRVVPTAGLALSLW